MLADYAGVTWKTQQAILASDNGPIPQGLVLWKYRPLIYEQTNRSFTGLFLLSIKTVLLRLCVNKTYEICKYYLQYHPDLKIV